MGTEYKTARGRQVRPSFIMAACTRQPTRLAPVPTGRAKSKKRRADDPLEAKTEVLEEGELAAWFLNKMAQATQTEPVPYAPVDRPGVWMCPLHSDETLTEGHVSRVQSPRPRGRMDDPGDPTVA